VALRTRDGHDASAWFPEITSALARYRGGPHVVDGEVCVLDGLASAGGKARQKPLLADAFWIKHLASRSSSLAASAITPVRIPDSTNLDGTERIRRGLGRGCGCGTRRGWRRGRRSAGSNGHRATEGQAEGKHVGSIAGNLHLISSESY
jgi:hypothetical protein